MSYKSSDRILTGTLVFSLVLVSICATFGAILSLFGQSIGITIFGVSLIITGMFIFVIIWRNTVSRRYQGYTTTYDVVPEVVTPSRKEKRSTTPPKPLRGTCGTCGKTEFMPFQCSRCGGLYCADHRLPESHSCPSLVR